MNQFINYVQVFVNYVMIKWKILSVSDQNLLKLYKLFDGTFERAIDLYEQRRVTQISTSNTIITECKCANEASWLMQVRGHSGALYTLFPEINYCTCAAFRYNPVWINYLTQKITQLLF